VRFLTSKIPFYLFLLAVVFTRSLTNYREVGIIGSFVVQITDVEEAVRQDCTK